MIIKIGNVFNERFRLEISLYVVTRMPQKNVAKEILVIVFNKFLKHYPFINFFAQKLRNV